MAFLPHARHQQEMLRAGRPVATLSHRSLSVTSCIGCRVFKRHTARPRMLRRICVQLASMQWNTRSLFHSWSVPPQLPIAFELSRRIGRFGRKGIDDLVTAAVSNLKLLCLASEHNATLERKIFSQILLPVDQAESDLPFPDSGSLTKCEQQTP